MTKERFIQLLREAVTDFAPAISCSGYQLCGRQLGGERLHRHSQNHIYNFHRHQDCFQDIRALYLP